jgi:hypothetical protein
MALTSIGPRGAGRLIVRLVSSSIGITGSIVFSQLKVMHCIQVATTVHLLLWRAFLLCGALIRGGKSP